MPDWLSIDEPVLVNTIGHSAGVVIFGMLLYFLVINRLRSREDRSRLAVLAAALAMLWNLGSLVALATGPTGGIIADIIVAASFSVLSLLPAVLLHISLESRHRAVWLSGYVLSAIAVALHVVDLLTQAPRFHYAALLLVTVGFSVLTIAGVEIIGEADNGAVALDKIAEHRPDLVLLDLQMPAMSGLDVVRNIRSGTHMPVIVIVTAYDKYALQAFEAGAIDYLLKPVGQERLAAAIERAKRVTGKEAVERLAQLQEIGDPRSSPLTRKIVGKVGEEYFLLGADEIYAF